MVHYVVYEVWLQLLEVLHVVLLSPTMLKINLATFLWCLPKVSLKSCCAWEIQFVAPWSEPSFHLFPRGRLLSHKQRHKWLPVDLHAGSLVIGSWMIVDDLGWSWIDHDWSSESNHSKNKTKKNSKGCGSFARFRCFPAQQYISTTSLHNVCCGDNIRDRENRTWGIAIHRRYQKCPAGPMASEYPAIRSSSGWKKFHLLTIPGCAVEVSTGSVSWWCVNVTTKATKEITEQFLAVCVIKKMCHVQWFKWHFVKEPRNPTHTGSNKWIVSSNISRCKMHELWGVLPGFTLLFGTGVQTNGYNPFDEIRLDFKDHQAKRPSVYL